MTDSQEKHLARGKEHFCVLADAKYRKGAAEHCGEFDGELLSAPTLRILDHAIDEAIDQVVYLLSLREKLRGEAS